MTEEMPRSILQAINDLRKDLGLPPRIEKDDFYDDIVLVIDIVRRLRLDAMELRRYD